MTHQAIYYCTYLPDRISWKNLLTILKTFLKTTQHSSFSSFHHFTPCFAFVLIIFFTIRVILDTTILCSVAILSPTTTTGNHWFPSGYITYTRCVQNSWMSLTVDSEMTVTLTCLSTNRCNCYHSFSLFHTLCERYSQDIQSISCLNTSKSGLNISNKYFKRKKSCAKLARHTWGSCCRSTIKLM